MSYNRKIFYMSFYEGNDKRGNAGYIKVLENQGVQIAEVRLSGISPVFDGERELEIFRGKTLVNKEKIVLQEGGGMAKCGWEMTDGITGLSFCINLGNGCVLDSADRSKPLSDQRTAVEEMVEEKVEDIPLIKNIVEEEREEQGLEWEQPQLEAEEEKVVQAEEQQEKKTDAKEKVENRKWKQICKVYPHIKPFQDFRDYIKLDLKDMVLISEKKYSLVENSFLLHGYYNYDHIILWKKEKTPVKYYIGVPGNFYEKEKQVAVLYGFESFEGAVEPAKEGDFGYYMTEVSI